MRRLLLSSVLALCAAGALADGGRVRLRQDAGSFAITVFTQPEPLTSGPADLSVLVQDRATGRPLLDAEVEIRLKGPGAESTRTDIATSGTNRILKVIATDLPAPGNWRYEVVVRRGGETATVTGMLPVGARASRISAIWPYLATPPLVIVLFAWREAHSRRRRSGR
jgi:hypothetical protein